MAPHPDDETLAAARPIQRVLAQRGQVRVVVLTSGDGYSVAARDYFHRATLSRKDLLRFGSIRMAEPRQAAQRLGMDPRDVVFLGFPDRCLMGLLLSGSTQSRYTGAGAVPYQQCLRPGAPYTRQALEEQLYTAIAYFRTTLILFPSAGDGHPDHRAAHFSRFLPGPPRNLHPRLPVTGRDATASCHPLGQREAQARFRAGRFGPVPTA